MKKFLLVLFLTGFTCLSANAYSVHYMNGHPVSVNYSNGYSRSINNFGRNAAFLPQTQARAARYRRAVARQVAITKAIENMGNNRYPSRCGYGAPNRINHINTASAVTSGNVSRLNRNYSIKSQKSYSRNGITYYN